LPPVSAHSVPHTAHTNALHVTSIQYAKAKEETNKVDTERYRWHAEMVEDNMQKKISLCIRQ